MDAMFSKLIDLTPEQQDLRLASGYSVADYTRQDHKKHGPGYRAELEPPRADDPAAIPFFVLMRFGKATPALCGWVNTPLFLVCSEQIRDLGWPVVISIENDQPVLRWDDALEPELIEAWRRHYSASPMRGGLRPADAVLRGTLGRSATAAQGG